MTKLKIICITFIIATFLNSCEEGNIEPAPIEPNTNIPLSEQSVFSNPTVGKINLFVAFEAETSSDQDYSYTYIGDTLEVKVMSYIGGKYLIKEEYTKNSNIRNSLTDPRINEYYFHKDDDHFFVEHLNDSDDLESSYLFGVLSTERKLPLNLLNADTTEIIGWNTTLEYCSCIQEGYINQWDINGNNFEKLNAYIDYSSVIFDGPGYTWIYSKDYGVVRFMSKSRWLNDVKGWDWIAIVM